MIDLENIGPDEKTHPLNPPSAYSQIVVNELVDEIKDLREACDNAASRDALNAGLLESLDSTARAYATAARSIAISLNEFCDESLTYDQMIADAARKAIAEIEKLRNADGGDAS